MGREPSGKSQNLLGFVSSCVKQGNTVVPLSSEVTGFRGGSKCKQSWKVDRKSVNLKY